MPDNNCDLADIPDTALYRNGKSSKCWLCEMKKACDENSRYTLGKEQIQLLKEIGLDKMLSNTEKDWYLHFNELA